MTEIERLDGRINRTAIALSELKNDLANHVHKTADTTPKVSKRQHDDELAQLHNRLDNIEARITTMRNEFSNAWKDRDSGIGARFDARFDDLASEFTQMREHVTEGYSRLRSDLNEHIATTNNRHGSLLARIQDLEEGPVEKPGNGSLSPVDGPPEQPKSNNNDKS